MDYDEPDLASIPLPARLQLDVNWEGADKKASNQPYAHTNHTAVTRRDGTEFCRQWRIFSRREVAGRRRTVSTGWRRTVTSGRQRWAITSGWQRRAIIPGRQRGGRVFSGRRRRPVVVGTTAGKRRQAVFGVLDQDSGE